MGSKRKKSTRQRISRVPVAPPVEAVEPARVTRTYDKHRWAFAGLAVVVAVGIFILIYRTHSGSSEAATGERVVASSATTAAESHYVGRAACASCHATEDAAWHG